MPHAWRIDTVDGAPPTTLGTAHDMGLVKWKPSPSEQTKIFLWNPMPTLCPGRVCTVYPQEPTQAGEFTPWFFDENHLGTAMLEELFEPFIDQLELVLAAQ